MKRIKCILYFRCCKLFLSFIIISLSVGCTGKKQIATPNSIVSDKDFQTTFENHKILVAAPGSGTPPEKIDALKSLNCLNIEIPDNLVTEEIPIHANGDAERFHFLKKAILNPSKTAVIWTLRGGYGSARLVDMLNKLPKPKHEKIFIGFSDVTALHLFLSQHWHWKTIHGSGLLGLLDEKNDPDNFGRIAKIVSKEVLTTKIDNLKPLNAKAKNTKNILGRLTGGNLSIVQSSVGTHWQIKSADKILFIEDTGEHGYRIDRMLNHLKQAGVFNKVKAVVLGDFTDQKDEYVTFVLQRFAAESAVPVFKTDQFGHGKTNYPLVYNSMSKIISIKEDEFELVMKLKD